MAEHGNCLALTVETATEIFIFQVVVLQDLDRHQPVESVAACFVHHGHTAGTDDL